MTTPTHPRDRDTKPFTCRRCNGPCRAYAGSIHGWTCTTCLNEAIGLTNEPSRDALPMGIHSSTKSQQRQENP